MLAPVRVRPPPHAHRAAAPSAPPPRAPMVLGMMATTARALIALLLLGPAAARADQVLRGHVYRAPKGKNSEKRREEPWQAPGLHKAEAPLHHVSRGLPIGGHQQHDREVPYVRGADNERLWNGPPTFGAGLPQQAWQPPPPPATQSGTLPRPGGDLRRRIRQAIRRNQAQRYQHKLEGLALMDQYRAEKAMLGLCPIDGCEQPRFILEGRAFTDEGHCEVHTREAYGDVRVDWRVDAVRRRFHERRRQARTKARRREDGARFPWSPKASAIPTDPDELRARVRAVFGHAALPGGFPRPGDLGPNGTLPQFADPRDPAGYPYDTVDTDPGVTTRPVEREATTWVQQALIAP